MAGWKISIAVGEKFKAVGEAHDQLFGIEMPDASRRKLDGQGQPIQSRAEETDVGRVAIGQGEIARTAPFRYSLNETQDIGRDEGTPVDFSYQSPFAFKGKASSTTKAAGTM